MSYIDIHETKDSIIVWERGNDGVLKKIQHDIGDFCYLFMPDNTGKAEYKDLWNRPMKKSNFKNKYDMKEFVTNHDDICESDVRPKYKCLIDLYRDVDITTLPNILFYDIEVDFDLEDGRGYPKPTDPFGEINAFSCFDYKNKEFYMLIPDHLRHVVRLKDEHYKVNIIWTQDERDMLLTFSELLEDFDIFCGWYTAGFDLPYIMERAIMHFGEKEASKMFCRDGLKAKRRDFVNEHGEDVWEWETVGRQHIDMQALYKKFNPGEKTSFSLDAICELELGESKLEFLGDLGVLYRENPKKFFEYSLHDTRLLYMLEDKANIVALAVMMARQNCVTFSDVTGSVKAIETGLIRFCRDKGNIVLPDKVHTEKMEKFKGAIVYDTLSGRHGWMFSIDLTALYPSAMIMLGVSPETLLMQCKGGFADYVSIMSKHDRMITVEVIASGEEIEISAKDLEEFVRQEGYTISANGTIFSGELGLLSEFTQSIFNLRKHFQGLKKDATKAGDGELEKRYDLFQKVFKILANSIYGATGNEHFRLFDIRIAQSITLTGQMISKFQAVKANELVNEVTELMAA